MLLFIVTIVLLSNSSCAIRSRERAEANTDANDGNIELFSFGSPMF